MIQEKSDEQLLLLFQEGDHGAFSELYSRHKDSLYRYFLRQCQQVLVAEELAQDVWTNIIRQVQQYQEKAKFTTYLYHIAHNRLIDHHRRQQVRPVEMHNPHPGMEAQACAGSQPEQQLQDQQRLEEVKRLVAELPREQRDAFLLKQEAGLNQEEIAHITGTNPETVKSRLRYAYTKLRQALGVNT